jgi:acyl-CoA hydrolase
MRSWSLIEAGAVTGKRKTVDRGKVIGSFCMGVAKLYDYIDDNPLFSFRPTQYVNDANVIGKHNNMVTINMALQIDLTGQVSVPIRKGASFIRESAARSTSIAVRPAPAAVDRSS